jgi:hypothetical protein
MKKQLLFFTKLYSKLRVFAFVQLSMLAWWIVSLRQRARLAQTGQFDSQRTLDFELFSFAHAAIS